MEFKVGQKFRVLATSTPGLVAPSWWQVGMLIEIGKVWPTNRLLEYAGRIGGTCVDEVHDSDIVYFGAFERRISEGLLLPLPPEDQAPESRPAALVSLSKPDEEEKRRQVDFFFKKSWTSGVR